MLEYFEPMLYMSTPDHPNTMGVMVTLAEAIDGEVLAGVVEDLRARFPYFYVRAVPLGGDLVTEPNPLPMSVRGTWDPIELNSKEANFHLGAWKFEGRRLAFEVSHALTDGAGVMPYIKSALFLYLTRRYGLSLDRTGFRLPGDEIPESETGDPLAGLDVDGAEEPLFEKETVADFYRPGRGAALDPWVTYVRLPEDQLMACCRDFDGTPNAFLSVMMARAARRCDPDDDRTISVSVAINHKAILGNRDNYRMFSNAIEVDFPKGSPLGDLMRSCTIARGQIMAQSQPDNALWEMRKRKATRAMLDQLPLEQKLGLIARSAGVPRWSMTVSYTDGRSFGPLDPYIEELYVVAESSVTDVICEVACINHSFFLAVGQNFSSDEFVTAFLRELAEVGIDCEPMGRERLGLCGMAPYVTVG